SGKRERFEQLLDQVQMSAEMKTSYFQEACLERLEVRRKNRSWTIYFQLPGLIPADVLADFDQKLKERFARVAEVDWQIACAAQVDDRTLIEEYWPLFLQWLQREVVSVNGWMTKAKLEVKGAVIHLQMLNETGIEMARKKQVDVLVKRYFSRYFG